MGSCARSSHGPTLTQAARGRTSATGMVRGMFLPEEACAVLGAKSANDPPRPSGVRSLSSNAMFGPGGLKPPLTGFRSHVTADKNADIWRTLVPIGLSPSAPATYSLILIGWIRPPGHRAGYPRDPNAKLGMPRRAAAARAAATAAAAEGLVGGIPAMISKWPRGAPMPRPRRQVVHGASSRDLLGQREVLDDGGRGEGDDAAGERPRLSAFLPVVCWSVCFGLSARHGPSLMARLNPPPPPPPPQCGVYWSLGPPYGRGRCPIWLVSLGDNVPVWICHPGRFVVVVDFDRLVFSWSAQLRRALASVPWARGGDEIDDGDAAG